MFALSLAVAEAHTAAASATINRINMAPGTVWLQIVAVWNQNNL
jgi:hypothetical protein